MRLFSFLGLAALVCLLSNALCAQGTIDVQYPIGTSRANGATVNYGKTGNGETFTLNVRIENVDSVDGLDLIANPTTVQGGGYKNVQVTINGIPPAQTLAPGATVDLSLDVDPSKDSDWSFVITIHSSDTTNGTFTLKFKGTEGKPEDDDDCSTREGSGPGLLILLGILSTLVVASRLRAARG
jgi:hypothetical protein